MVERNWIFVSWDAAPTLESKTYWILVPGTIAADSASLEGIRAVWLLSEQSVTSSMYSDMAHRMLLGMTMWSYTRG